MGASTSARAVKSVSAGLAALVVFSALPVFASTITVSNTNDSGAGSLRDAIANASSGDTIDFSVTGTITLATKLTIPASMTLTINGPGASSLAISGNDSVQVLFIDVGSGVTAAISGLTIEHGSAQLGGGIFNGGTLTLTDCIVASNTGTTQGGGVYNVNAMKVINSTISGNSAPSGGGIANVHGTLSLVNSTFSGNSASLTASLTDGEGGGLQINGGSAAVSNCTFAGNSAADNDGGGIWSDDNLVVKNSILANNTQGGNCVVAGTPTSAGHNLSDDASCSTTLFTLASDKNSTNVELDPGGLQNNGGPTPTIALQPTSPAVDAIPTRPTNYCTDVSGNPVTIDQRGIPRPQGAACDSGAYELVPSCFPVPAAQTLLIVIAVQSSSLPQGREQGLLAPLRAALCSLNRCQVRPAIQQLEAFINHANALVRSGALTPQQASALTALAQAVIQSLGG